MKVEIDGVLYVPMGSQGADAGEAVRALLLAWTTGYYHSVRCGESGDILYNLEDTCSSLDCHSCRLFKATVSLLGDKFKRVEDPIIEQILST